MNEDDPDAAILQQRYPGLKCIGERLNFESDPNAGDALIIRRRLTERGSVLFTIKYDDGRIRDWEYFD
jgi:hypothetical protein